MDLPINIFTPSVFFFFTGKLNSGLYAMKHILAVHEASNVATSQELEKDEEFDLPASGESAVQVCSATNLFLLGISQW